MLGMGRLVEQVSFIWVSGSEYRVSGKIIYPILDTRFPLHNL